ncbi:DUF7716 domain-containing protein [Vreelandella olivaria]|uniref:DUF7716 domain-containing protein n=1 Tax=Vreelandella olivaria TaxID=390919 RepID=UPI00201F3E4C|nr:hypothetical protein [Halomonas olivaria]
MAEKLGDVLDNLDIYEWRDWVYLDQTKGANLRSSCIVLNPDEAELSEDGFTPLAVERLSMEEFLSIQDLISVRDNLLVRWPSVGIKEICDAAVYYYENDAFIPLQS